MQSNGGLTDAQRFQGKDAILSGPAGGIVGMVRTAARGRLRAHHRLRHGRHLDRRVALRRRVRARVRDAGGRRAHARADDEHPHRRRRRRLDPALRRRALPRRAGVRRRQPGPGVLPARRAAHRHRRQRDARARSSRSTSRRCSGRNGDEPLDAGVVRRASSPSWPRRSATGRAGRRSPKASCRSRSATWPTRSSTSRCSAATTSPRYTLCCFGGAAGQHACLVADALAMKRVFIHPLAGVLSAYGMGLADQVAIRQQAIEARLDADLLNEIESRLADDARDELLAQGVAAEKVAHRGQGAPQVRRHRHRAAGAARHARGNDRALRSGVPQAVLLPDAGQGAGRRGDFGRGQRRRRGLRGTDASSDKPHAAAAETVQDVQRRALARHAGLPARSARARASASPARRSSPRPMPPRWSSPSGWRRCPLRNGLMLERTPGAGAAAPPSAPPSTR